MKKLLLNSALMTFTGILVHLGFDAGGYGMGWAGYFVGAFIAVVYVLIRLAALLVGIEK